MKKIFTLFLSLSISWTFAQNNFPLENVVTEGYTYFTGNIVSDVRSGSEKMFMTQDGNKLFRNDGTNWQEVLNVSTSTIKDIIVDNNEVWVIKDDKVMTSNNYGDSWKEYIALPQEDPEFITQDLFKRGNYLFISKYGISISNGQKIKKVYKTEIKNIADAWTSLPLNATTGYAYYKSSNQYYQDYDGQPYFFLEDGRIVSFREKRRISSDEGISWTESTYSKPWEGQYTPEYDIPWPKVVHNTTIAYFQANRLYISNDLGSSTFESTGFPWFNKINDVRFYNNVILVDTGYKGMGGEGSLNDGIYISKDNGVSFQKLNDGLSYYDIAHGASFSATDANIFIGYQNGFKKINVDNLSTIDINNNFNNFIPKDITQVDSDADGRMYVYSNIYGLSISNHLGNTWVKDHNLMDPYKFVNTSISASNNNTIFAQSYNPGKLSKSVDGGINWTILEQISPYTLVNVFADKNNSNRVITSSQTPDGITLGTLFSKDGGLTFGEKYNGYYKGIDSEIPYDVVFFDNDTIIILYNKRILKTINNGVTWQSFTADNLFKELIKVDNKIYAKKGASVYESNDKGVTWSLVAPPSVTIYEIYSLCEFNIPGVVSKESFAMATNKGVFALINNAWVNITTEVYSYLTFNVISNELFLSNRNSMKKLRTSLLSAVNYNSLSRTEVTLFPNPTESVVNLISPNEKIIEINIYNAAGNLVKKQMSSKLKDQINLHSFPDAVYFMEIKTNKGTVTKKVIKK